MYVCMYYGRTCMFGDFFQTTNERYNLLCMHACMNVCMYTFEETAK